MTILYGIKNCDTMKKTRLWLDEHGVEYSFHDYKKSGIERTQLKNWVKQVGWDTLLNRRGTTWRKLPDAAREGINQASAIELMLEQPSMIKRPVLDHNGSLLVGFDPDAFEKSLS